MMTSVTTTAPTTDKPVIVTEQLTKIYGDADFRAVDDLNLSVFAGEIFGLLGPNGAGKTTTAGMLTTRVIPTSGTATVAGVNVVQHPAVAKQFLGVVSQTNTLDRQLTVWENLYFHGRLFGISSHESRVTSDRLLEQFQLAKWAKASVYALSGGWLSDSWWHARYSTGPRCCSWTNQPRGSIHRAASLFGRSFSS